MQITTSGKASNPSIDGNRIVYEDVYANPNLENNIYMYDITTEKTTQITNSGHALNPCICSNKIVYTDRKAIAADDMDSTNIYMFEL